MLGLAELDAAQVTQTVNKPPSPSRSKAKATRVSSRSDTYAANSERNRKTDIGR